MGPILEYFEPGDLKPVKTEELQDPGIKISSDSDTEETGPSHLSSQPAPRLNELHDRQQRALLDLGPVTNAGFSNTEKRCTPVKGWTVETIGNRNFIPCPECKGKARLERKSTLTDHLTKSHPSELRNRWPCLLCPESRSISRNFPAIPVWDVFNHMREIHGLAVAGKTARSCSTPTVPKAQPAWIPTDSSATSVWTFLNDDFVQCTECVNTQVKICNMTRHYKKCHKKKGVYDGVCGHCNQHVCMKDLVAHRSYGCLRPSVSVISPRQTGQTHEHSAVEHGDILSRENNVSSSRSGPAATSNTKLWGDTSSLGKRRHQSEISRKKRARMAEPVPAMAPPVAMPPFRPAAVQPGCQPAFQTAAVKPGCHPAFQPAAVQVFCDSSPPNRATWSVLKGTLSSLLQCPQCPRKLELQSLNNHMVGKV